MKTLIISVLAAASVASFASAETVEYTADLLSSIAGSTSSRLTISYTDADSGTTYGNFQGAGLSAASISAWLDGQNDGVYWVQRNGNGSASTDPVSASLTSADGTYTLTFTNRRGYSGSDVGLVTSLTSEQVSGLETLSVTYTASANVDGTLCLVYQVDGEWQMTSGSFTVGTALTLTYTLEDGSSLTDSNVFVVLETTSGAGNSQTGTIALTATYAVDEAVPEPATATLSLLALAGLAARRRRK